MTLGQIALATLLSGLAASMTDWLFFGVLFHDKMLVYPEVWRRTGGGGETKAVVVSVLLGFVTCAGFAFACSAFRIHGYSPALEFAVAIWVLAPLVIVVTNALFIKLHPLTVVAHSLGWLVKLLLAAVAVGWFWP
jgi:hypothetical protein